MSVPWDHGKLGVTQDGRYLEHEDGTPFFWLGDTAWLLFARLDREEVTHYLRDRARKGFNVAQVMVLHELGVANAYGHRSPASFDALDGSEYFQHVDFAVDAAAKAGLYLGLVAAWGSIVASGALDVAAAERYGTWLGRRYGGRPNIVWIIGGDVRGDRNREVWCALAESIRGQDPGHLMTFHPFGRTQSSRWFHREPWLCFNMFQSGHRRYDQRPEDESPVGWKGEDNWRYVLEDHAMDPAKPTIDGEPSYEDIPQGLHDPSQPRWTNDDCRRYAYWSVFAGAFGHTFGNNAVMQMHNPAHGEGSYGVRRSWHQAIHDPGASEMTHLGRLMATVACNDRSYAPQLIDGEPGNRYDRLIATAGRDFALIYTHTGRPIRLALGGLEAHRLSASWFRPMDGSAVPAGEIPNRGIRTFEPPPTPESDRDRVLVLRRAEPYRSIAVSRSAM